MEEKRTYVIYVIKRESECTLSETRDWEIGTPD